ncbi:hypothetical protein PENVUL_c011G08899 [Penicillium vulpinum]|uniref:Uncharacterized protein n=2 Tax=Penicillium vulpinum TaxID=29845 RepID=A0A1V6S250_9EURO|nr:hypothetical protein PENVUL_c011G08899 [Penicillium vulpinum]
MSIQYKEQSLSANVDDSSDNLLPWDASDIEQSPPRRQRWRVYFYRFKTFLYISLALYGIMSLLIQTVSLIQLHQPINCECGSSTTEAISKGCKYDTMSAAWLPVACRDDELSAEFDRMGPGPNGQWYYWADENRTRELSIEELSLLPDQGLPFFTNWDWHVAHCTYRWRKQLRPGFLFGRMNIQAAYDHIVHCEEVMRVHDREQTIISGVGLSGSTYS